MLRKVRHIHFIGIAGIGMSSIASILLERGFCISGSDLKQNHLTEELCRRGGRVFLGHRASNLLDSTGLVVYSTSIGDDNPEVLKAREKKIPVLHRSEIVAGLINSGVGIAVTGAHGKTTTTALSGLLLMKAGLDPTIIIGGEPSFLKGNWRNGASSFVVCEADESDGTFMKLRPSYAILTNIDREHLEHYKDFGDLVRANKVFMDNVEGGGCLITCYDDPHIKGLLNGYKKRILTYSRCQGSGADVYSSRIDMDRAHTFFEPVFKGDGLGTFELNIPGRHNVENSLAVILLGIELGIDIKIIRQALSEYKGTSRRFEVKAVVDDVMVVEDYAHHPTELMATISACRNWPGRRLVGVFQPHRYTRTKFLREEFGKSFLGLDELILTDIYSASEKPIQGVTARGLYEEALKNGQKVARLMSREEIVPYLLQILKGGEIVLILGAGDIGELSGELVGRLRDKREGIVQRASV